MIGHHPLFFEALNYFSDFVYDCPVPPSVDPRRIFVIYLIHNDFIFYHKIYIVKYTLCYILILLQEYGAEKLKWYISQHA